jgi:hypothetical protein
MVDLARHRPELHCSVHHNLEQHLPFLVEVSQTLELRLAEPPRHQICSAGHSQQRLSLEESKRHQQILAGLECNLIQTVWMGCSLILLLSDRLRFHLIPLVVLNRELHCLAPKPHHLLLNRPSLQEHLSLVALPHPLPKVRSECSLHRVLAPRRLALNLDRTAALVEPFLLGVSLLLATRQSRLKTHSRLLSMDRVYQQEVFRLGERDPDLNDYEHSVVSVC